MATDKKTTPRTQSADTAAAEAKAAEATAVETATVSPAPGLPPGAKLSEAVQMPAPDPTAEPAGAEIPLDTNAFTGTLVKLDDELDVLDLLDAEDGAIVPNESADTAVSPVIRAVSLASTVGPGVDMLLTTRLDVPTSAEVAGATVSGDLVEVFTGNVQFAGTRGGVAFADGRGLATAEQATRLVREFGYRCPALSA